MTIKKKWNIYNHCEPPAKFWATMIGLLNGMGFWLEEK